MGITLEVPESVASSLRLPEGEAKSRLLRELALSLCAPDVLSFGKASELSGLNRYDFGRCSAAGIGQYGPEVEEDSRPRIWLLSLRSTVVCVVVDSQYRPNASPGFDHLFQMCKSIPANHPQLFPGPRRRSAPVYPATSSSLQRVPGVVCFRIFSCTPTYSPVSKEESDWQTARSTSSPFE